MAGERCVANKGPRQTSAIKTLSLRYITLDTNKGKAITIMVSRANEQDFE